MDAPAIERIRAALDYDGETGKFTWRRRDRCGRSNDARWTGKPAGSPVRKGHIRIEIDGRGYYAHRLAWLFHYGEWPSVQVDHINGDPADNRIANLRLATNAENGRNRRIHRNNTSGVKGVGRSGDKWIARIKFNYQHIHIGTFSTLEEAAQAYAHTAERLYGSFARTEP